MIRAPKTAPEMVVLEPGGVQVEPATGRFVLPGGVRGRLTAVERMMLVVLVAHRGETVTREQLFAATHDGTLPDPSGLRAVDQAVSRLRRRLFTGPGGITAVRGKGYRLAPALRDEPPEAVVRTSAIIGRDTEIAVIEAELAPHRRAPRRVELVGAGGIGKSSLAREVARRAATRGERAVWVPLAGASDATQVLSHLAAALHVVAGSGRDAAALVRAIESQLVATNGADKSLIVLDDVDAGATEVSKLLAQSEALGRCRILVTARRKTGLGGARTLAVGPLTDEAALTLLALRAFEEREAPARPEEMALLAVAASALRGWPLALELAAVRLREAGPGDLLPHLERLVQHAPRELVGLTAVLDEMWRGLQPGERETLSLVAIAGGDVPVAMLAAASDAAQDEAQAHLRELYRTGWLGSRRTEGRVELHALVRDFVMQQIGAPEREAFLRLLGRHARRLWALPLSNDPRIVSELASLADPLELGLAMTRASDPDAAAMLALALGRHHLLSGPRERTVAVAGVLTELLPRTSPALARAMHGMRAWLLNATDEGDGGAVDAQACLAASTSPSERAEALTLVARTHRHMPDVAEPALREALELRVSLLDRARAEATLASFLTREERYDEALGPMMRAIEALDASQSETRYAQENYLAVILVECGMPRHARRVFEQAEATYLRLSKGGATRPGFFATRALLALDAADGASAEKLLRQVVETADRAGRPALAAIASVWLIGAALLQGHLPEAKLYAQSVASGASGAERSLALAPADRAFYHGLRAIVAPDAEAAAVELACAKALIGRRYPATTRFVSIVAREPCDARPCVGLRARLAERLARYAPPATTRA